jgi:hypothetical protein
VSVIAVAAIAFAIVLAASGGPGVPGAGIAPADFVVSSTQNTLAQHTADVVFSGSVTVAGHDVPLNGTGQADFSTNGFSATLSETAAGTSLVERELADAGHLYMGMTIDGHDMSEFTGGARWISIPTPGAGSSSPGVGSVDPLSQIQLLEKKGATVVRLGTSVIDGDTVSGYSVTPSPSQVQQSLQQEFAAGQFTPAQQQQILDASKALGTFSSDVWVDSSGLLRRETVNVGGGTSGATGKVDVTFSNFGTPVTIEPPAAGDVISFSQFDSDLQALQASPGNQ